MTQPSPAPRFWPTAGPLGLAVIGLTVLTALSVRFTFRSAMLYLLAVVFVSLTGNLPGAAAVSLIAFLCLAAFVSPAGLPTALVGLGMEDRGASRRSGRLHERAAQGPRDG